MMGLGESHRALGKLLVQQLGLEWLVVGDRLEGAMGA